MRYLHHRMRSCPEEQELLRRASALAAAREPDTPPPLPLRPLQVGSTYTLLGAGQTQTCRCRVTAQQS